MNPEDSVLRLWEGVRRGDPDNETELFTRLYPRLVESVRKHLLDRRSSNYDEDDIAASAIKSLFLGASDGRFTGVADRNGLWRLLITIATRKAAYRERKSRTLKRGGTLRKRNSHVGSPTGESRDALSFVVDERQDTPAEVHEAADLLLALLRSLDDKAAERIVLLRLESRTRAEIAAEVGCSPRTVERKLRKAYRAWNQLSHGTGQGGFTGEEV